MKKNTMKVNLMVLGIITLVVGLLYIFVGVYLYNEYFDINSWSLVMAIEGVVLETVSFGLFTKNLLPNEKWSFLYGFLLGIIGIIIAVCIKHSNNKYKGNKYEDIEKLQKLKENGVITEEEFEIEKTKILK